MYMYIHIPSNPLPRLTSGSSPQWRLGPWPRGQCYTPALRRLGETPLIITNPGDTRLHWSSSDRACMERYRYMMYNYNVHTTFLLMYMYIHVTYTYVTYVHVHVYTYNVHTHLCSYGQSCTFTVHTHSPFFCSIALTLHINIHM